MNLVNKSIDLAGRLALHELDRRASVGPVGKLETLALPAVSSGFSAVRLLIRPGGLTPSGVTRLDGSVFGVSRGYSITPTNCNFLQFYHLQEVLS